MKELADIVALARTGQVADAALATVVRIDGSSYRQPGASLLVGPDGRRLGSVSGGCLERDVEHHARTVLATGEPRLITYDTRGDADAIFGTGLGCGGLVELFLERVHLQGDDAGPVAQWAAAAARRASTIEVMIVAAPDAAPLRTGARAWLTRGAGVAGAAVQGGRADSDPAAGARIARVDGDPAAAAQVARIAGGPAATASVANVDGDPAAAALLAALVDAARADLDAGRSTIVAQPTPSGEIRAFLRVIEPPIRLLLCGAGDDAQPVARMAAGLGWRVWVLDHRAAFATADRFPGAERVEVTPAGTLPPAFSADPRTVAMVMNHHYPADSAWLNVLAPLPLPYLGLLGARHRTARLLRELELPAPGPDGLAHLYAPAGLDIGAEGPEAIALSIVAEMQAVLAGRSGGRLRDVLKASAETLAAEQPVAEQPVEPTAAPPIAEPPVAGQRAGETAPAPEAVSALAASRVPEAAGA